VTVDVTAGTRRLAPPPTPPSYAPPKLNAVDGDQRHRRRRRRRRRMLQAVAAVLVPLVAVDFHPSFQLIVTPRFRSCIDYPLVSVVRNLTECLYLLLINKNVFHTPT